ncbi:MAG TPA: ATP-binding protein [Vicinamibacterales bacterium]|nr:ATP-binding protein [Vicinamibacterales bacterium]
MSVTILIVEDDPALQDLLEQHARAAGMRAITASTRAGARERLDAATVDVVVIDLTLEAEAGLELIRDVKARTPDVEVVVISGSPSLASAIQSFELSAFAFVQKPFDLDQLFATVQRAVERRRINADNRRLFWELQLVNEVGADLRRTLDPQELLHGVAQRLTNALGATSAAARLFNAVTREFDQVFTTGEPDLRAVWSGEGARLPRPSDVAIATRAPVMFADLHEGLAPELAARLPIRSAVSVPLIASEELLGTLSLGSDQPDHFGQDDQRLLMIIAGQVAVALQNARLATYARLGKRQWEATFDAISDSIAVFDERGCVLRGNTALARELGRPITEIRGLTCREIGLCGGRCPFCASDRAFAREITTTEVTRADGQVFSVTMFPVAGAPEGAAIVQVAKNVTEEIASARRLRQMSEEVATANGRLMAALERLKATQAQLLQAEKLSAIGQLVAGVAHELNNPLTSVIGYAQLVEEELLARHGEPPRPSEELAQDVRRIAEESERAARIVRNLLAFARRQTAARSPQDLGELAARVVALRAYEFRLNGIELESAFEPGLPPVLADAGQIQQALLNLVLNAEQAMRGGSVRRLRLEGRVVEDLDAVEIVLTDTGHGIERANLPRIFDPFFTTRDVGDGTGLGLSICYGIIRDHGGQITVDSEPGVGTTFTLTFPAIRVAPPTASEVLVAHGEEAERDHVAAMLGGWGWQVVTADTAHAAIERYRSGRLEAAFVGRAVLAADLPAWRAACQAEDGIPLVIMATSAQDEDDVARFARSAAAAVLAPPFDLRSLRSAMRAISRECV